MNENNTLTTP